MARVYLAHDTVLARDVALKVLREQYADDEEFVERFRREARSAASLSHPHIVQIYDRGRSTDGSYYITMEHLTGGTLKRRILQEGALPAHEAAGLALQIAGALGLAHERGVIHRDVKPQNILLTTAGNAKVGDFGIARASSATALSGTSMILGTAGYMSPEQAMGEPVGSASDLYSLGVVLYEMLTGALPYEAETPIGIALKHVNEMPRLPRETNPDVPEGLNAVTAKLLAKSPGDRYANTGELIQDLQRVRAGLPPLAPLSADIQETTALSRPSRRAAAPPPRVRGKSRRKVAGLAAAALASVGLLGGVALALSDDLPILEQARKVTGLGEENSEMEDLAVNPVEEVPVQEEPIEEEPVQEEPVEEEPVEEEPLEEKPVAADSEVGGQTWESPEAEDEAMVSSPPPAVQSEAQSTPDAPPMETGSTPASVAAPIPVASTEPVDPPAPEATQTSATSPPAPKPPKKKPQSVPAKTQKMPQKAAPKTTPKKSPAPQPVREEESKKDEAADESEDHSSIGSGSDGPVDFGPDGPVDFGPDGPIKSKSGESEKD